MAFDENFHLGIIKLYSEHLSPFWASTPPDSGAYGAVARDPSYLYHYLMSFPYRVLSFIGISEYHLVMSLRFINISLFAIGLYLYRVLLLKSNASKTIVNLVLFVFILIPIVPLLAAQINYDNAILPLTALSLILALNITRNRNYKSIDTQNIILLLFVCIFASLIKYPFLPIFLALLIFVSFVLIKKYKNISSIYEYFVKGLKDVKNVTGIVLIALLILVSGLFVERYGYNFIKYNNPVPDCGQVLNYDQCKYYGPWARDYKLEKTKGEFNKNPIAYTQDWAHGMWYRSYFAVSGPSNGYATRGPLLIPALTAIIAGVIGFVSFILVFPKILKKYNAHAILLFCLVVCMLVPILWLEEYKLFLQTGKAVAINGRYLLPIMPIIILLSALGLKTITIGRDKLRAVLASVLVLGFVWSGGVFTYILRSEVDWSWNRNDKVTSINENIKSLLEPITPGYSTPNEFLD